MRFVHYSPTRRLIAPSDFVWLGRAVNVFGYYRCPDPPRPRLLDRVVFCVPDHDEFRTLWADGRGEPLELSLPETVRVSVGLGGCFHMPCRVADVFHRIAVLRKEWGANKYEVAVPVRVIVRHCPRAVFST